MSTRVDAAARTSTVDVDAWLAECRAGREAEHVRRVVLRRELRQRHAQARRYGKAVGNARRLAEAEFRRALSAVDGDAGVALYRHGDTHPTREGGDDDGR